MFLNRYIFPYEALEKGIDLSLDKKTNDKEKPKDPAKEKENSKEKDKCKKPESDSENENNAVRRLTRMQSKNESDSEVERRETRSSRPRRNSLEKQFSLQESKGNKQMASPIDSSDESLGSYQEMNSYSRRGEMELDSDVTKQSEGDELVDIVNSPHSSVVSEDKEFSDTKSESELTMTEDGRYPIGARILVKYGKGKLHRAYEAKVCFAFSIPPSRSVFCKYSPTGLLLSFCSVCDMTFVTYLLPEEGSDPLFLLNNFV